MNKYWSKEEFEKVVKSAMTIREVLQHFGLPKNQGYYNKLFHKSVKEFNIDISHIMSSVKSQKFRKKIPLSDLFTKGTTRSAKSLKNRLIQEKIVEHKCCECNQVPNWNGKLLVLQLDHINGDNADNRIENLRLLCPNCHSQTETFGGKNAKNIHLYKHVCKTCSGYKKNTKSEKCIKCENESRKLKTKIIWPSVEIVLEMSKTLGFVKTGKQLGVSNNAVKKFLQRHNISIGRK